MSLAAVSKHLKVLEGAGLISRSRDAQWRPLPARSRTPPGCSEWLEADRRFWDRGLDGLADYLKVMQRDGSEPGK